MNLHSLSYSNGLNKRLSWSASKLLVFLVFAAFSLAVQARMPVTIHTQHGAAPLLLEVADEPEELKQGFMHRLNILPNEGMLFDFGRTDYVNMWMKNTPTSLDMIFVSEDMRINFIAEHTTPNSTDIIASPHPTRYVIELLAGTARQMHMAIGDKVSLNQP